jgi:hypothetical protein
MGARWGVGN